jgi:hypothetical protein
MTRPTRPVRVWALVSPRGVLTYASSLRDDCLRALVGDYPRDELRPIARESLRETGCRVRRLRPEEVAE